MKFCKVWLLGILCFVLASLTSCNNQEQFKLLEKNECIVYQYQTKDKYFSKYKDYHIFTNLDEIEYKNFTIFILNKKTDSMPNELYESLLEQFKEPKKIVFIQGNSDKIKYEGLACAYNWNNLGVVGSGIYWHSGTSNDDSNNSNEKIFFNKCLISCQIVLEDYLARL